MLGPVDLVYVIHPETLDVVVAVLGQFLVAQLVQDFKFGEQGQDQDLLVVVDLVQLVELVLMSQLLFL